MKEWYQWLTKMGLEMGRVTTWLRCNVPSYLISNINSNLEESFFVKHNSSQEGLHLHHSLHVLEGNKIKITIICYAWSLIRLKLKTKFKKSKLKKSNLNVCRLTNKVTQVHTAGNNYMEILCIMIWSSICRFRKIKYSSFVQKNQKQGNIVDPIRTWEKCPPTYLMYRLINTKRISFPNTLGGASIYL